MRCFHPLEAFQNEDGSIAFRESGHTRRRLTLRCGRCIGCRVSRAKDWQVRCVHEAKLHPFNSFVTLTYDKDHYTPSLNYDDFQKFLKRLRRKYGQCRYFVCGEYGSNGDRPHWHALLFGVHFADRMIWKRQASGYNLYRSAALEALWPFGFSTIGAVTPETASYCAQYCIKKVGGALADIHYNRVNVETGEVVDVVPEFARMSLKPGIGHGFLTKFKEDIYGGDFAVLEGRKIPTPRYYDNCLKKEDGFRFDDVEYDRFLRNQAFDDKDWTRERLEVCERVALAKFKPKAGDF